MKKFFTCRSRLISFCPAKIKIVFSPHLIPLLLGMLISVSVFAQNPGKIQGTVHDERGETLPGVSVMLKGTGTGTTTDVNGEFSINANPGQTLTFTFVGYASKEVVIKDSNSLTIGLIPSSSSLNEVVVVGYGEQKKLSLTTA